MKQFIEKHGKKIGGVLSGWDRLLFQGTLAAGRLCCVKGMSYYLATRRILLKEFAAHAKAMTAMLVGASLAEAERSRYLASSKVRKEEVARDLLRRNPVASGLICVLKCVEPCETYSVRGRQSTKKLELVKESGKCLHIYHYYNDPFWGFMHVRIQTWFPFTIRVWVNGRSWLAQRMDEEGMTYGRDENAFPWIDNFARAQSLMDGMLEINWPAQLNHFAQRINPARDVMFDAFRCSYYWPIRSSEWATDLCFRSPGDLAAIYPQLTQGAINGFCSDDVMRFLGKRPDNRFDQELVSKRLKRPEGVRVKHYMASNSIKMYDKGGRILRIETTINSPRPFQVLRPKQGHDDAPHQWLRMRRGIADQYRRTQVSHNANERYLDALASLDTTRRLDHLVEPITQPTRYRSQRVRGLRPWASQDRTLLQFIARPEHVISGFRNRDLLEVLYPDSQSPKDKRSAAARVSYRIRLLRAHGLIIKLPKTRRYRITPKGRQIVSAILLSQNATLQQLAKAAA